MKKSCKFAFFFAPLFCCLFLQSCNGSRSDADISETILSAPVTATAATPTSKDIETTVSPEAAPHSKSASEQKTEETLDAILDQLDELDAILDGY